MKSPLGDKDFDMNADIDRQLSIAMEKKLKQFKRGEEDALISGDGLGPMKECEQCDAPIEDSPAIIRQRVQALAQQVADEFSRQGLRMPDDTRAILADLGVRLNHDSPS